MKRRWSPQVVALLVLVGLVYAATSARWVLGGDNGEFASMLAQGGVPHPSGYPLYALYLRCFAWLPGASPAHSAALATSALGVLAVLTLRTGCRAWGASRESATLAAVVFAFSGLAWKLFTHAEVFALHALLASLIIAVSAPPGLGHRDFPEPGWFAAVRATPTRRVFALGALAGLGLCNNHSIVMMAPLGLFAAVSAVLGTRRPRTALFGLAGLGVGLLPYAWLVVQAGNTEGLVWGDTGSLGGLLHHFTRADYGSTQLAISDAEVSAFAHVARLSARLGAELIYVPLLAVVIGLARLVRRVRVAAPRVPSPTDGDAASVPLPLHRRTVEGSRAAVAITATELERPYRPGAGWAYLLTLLLAGPGFISRFNLPLEGLSLTIIERFYLLPLLLLVVPMALGFDTIVRRVPHKDWVGPTVVGVACLFIVVGYEPVREHHRRDVEDYLINTLHTAESDAVILGTGDHRLYGFWYVQRVLRERSDVTYVDPVMLAYPWYRTQVERRLGFALHGVDGTSVDSRALALGLQRAGRTVYLTNRFSDAIPSAVPTYPIGTLIRVAAPGERVPPPPALEQLNAGVASKYRYPDRAVNERNGWAAHVESAYTRPWRTLADAYEAAGMHEDAERCRNRHIIVPQRMP